MVNERLLGGLFDEKQLGVRAGVLDKKDLIVKSAILYLKAQLDTILAMLRVGPLNIDFDDMLWIHALKLLPTGQFDWILTDETQIRIRKKKKHMYYSLT